MSTAAANIAVDEMMAQVYADRVGTIGAKEIYLAVTLEARACEYRYCSLSCVCETCLRRDEYVTQWGRRVFLNEIATPAPLGAP